MLKVIQENTLYFRFYLAFFTLLFIYQLTQYQADALIFFSNHRTDFNDFFFKTLTRFGEEWAYLAVILGFLFSKKRKQALKILLAGLGILLVTQILKLVFAHDRPVTFFEQQNYLSYINLVQGVDILRGSNSFPSGHSAGGFALWTLMAFYFNKNIWAVVLFFTLAVLVGVSRMYLVAHFPEDVLLGSAIGVGIAIGIQYFMQFWRSKKPPTIAKETLLNA
jgi:membrane-associated phospholipid phosphatase